MSSGFTIALVGPGKEPIDLKRTFVSHGVASLPPMMVDEQAWRFEITLPVGRSARTVIITETKAHLASVEVAGRAPSTKTTQAIQTTLRHVLRFDLDLSAFYAAVAEDPDLSWVGEGAGRMIRSPTVFEDVVKTICTTNCSWAATEKMVGALVEHLGTRSQGAPRTGTRGRAFPTPEAMAEVEVDFYRQVVRAGYRADYLSSLARSVANRELELESWGHASSGDLSDDELEERLLQLPGVGPYAAAHVMLMLGRHSRLILDSWTRPKYARLVGRKSVADATIKRRFKRYGEYAGLAFWLFLTRDWIEDD